MSLQNFCNPFSYVISFPKAKNFQNLTIENGSKQRFSLLQEKVVIQAVCLRGQAVSIKDWIYTLNESYGYLEKVRKCQQPQTNAF